MLRVESCQEGESLCSEGGGIVGGGEVYPAKGQTGKQLRRFYAERKSRMVLRVERGQERKFISLEGGGWLVVVKSACY